METKLITLPYLSENCRIEATQISKAKAITLGKKFNTRPCEFNKGLGVKFFIVKIYIYMDKKFFTESVQCSWIDGEYHEIFKVRGASEISQLN